MNSAQSLKQYERDLIKWVTRVRKKVSKSAINKAATPILRKARELAPIESGLLRESLKGAKAKKVIAYKRDAITQAIIGPSRAVQGEHNGHKRVPANYGHLVEFGHVDRAGGFVSPKPFMRPAMESTKAEALRIYQRELAKGMEKEVAKR